jgi:outer membrane receptor protein involved in Fe transport
MGETIRSILMLAVVSVASLASVARAGEDKKEEALEDEIEELKEDDYPDLVAADEEGGIIDEFALLAEEDMVLTAAKHRQDIMDSPSAVTVITREQIENTYCTDVVCLLRSVPEVDVLRLIPMHASVGARALTGELGDKALVLVDGREINIEAVGMPWWQALPVHLEDIERIEVIRGPGSALYGANAHSMVVSIFTRRISETGAEAFLGAGEHGRISPHLRVDLTLGEWRLHFSGGADTAGNWRVPDKREREVSRIQLRLAHEGQEGASQLDLGLVACRGGFFTTLSPAHIKDGYMGHLRVSHENDFLRAQLYTNIIQLGFKMDIPLYYGEVKLGEMPDLVEFFHSVVDAELQMNFEPFAGNLLIAGGNYRWLNFLSDQNQPSTVNQHRVGVFIHDEQHITESLLLTAGVRLDYNSITPLAVSPRVAAVWRFSDSQLVRLAFGRAFRKPSFLNTSYHFKGVKGEAAFPELEEFFLESLGNEGLDNESITTFEAGYRGSFLEGSLIAEAGVFFNLYRDAINLGSEIVTSMGVPDLANSSLLFQNKGKEVNSLGGSASLTWRYKKILRAQVNYTYRYSWYITEPEEAATLGGKGDRVPWEPAHLANLLVHYRGPEGIHAGLGVHLTSSRDLAMLESGGLFDERVQVHNPAFCFASGYAAWRVWGAPGGRSWVEMGVRAYNLFGAGFRATPAVTRRDGTELGGELLGRRVLLFVRGAI